MHHTGEAKPHWIMIKDDKDRDIFYYDPDQHICIALQDEVYTQDIMDQQAEFLAEEQELFEARQLLKAAATKNMHLEMHLANAELLLQKLADMRSYEFTFDKDQTVGQFTVQASAVANALGHYNSQAQQYFLDKPINQTIDKEVK